MIIINIKIWRFSFECLVDWLKQIQVSECQQNWCFMITKCYMFYTLTLTFEHVDLLRFISRPLRLFFLFVLHLQLHNLKVWK